MGVVRGLSASVLAVAAARRVGGGASDESSRVEPVASKYTTVLSYHSNKSSSHVRTPTST